MVLTFVLQIGTESAIIYHHDLDAFYKRSKCSTRWVAIQFGSIAVVAVYMQCGVGRTTLEATANDEYRNTIDEVIKKHSNHGSMGIIVRIFQVLLILFWALTPTLN